MKLRPENEMLVMCAIALIVIILSAWLAGCATKTVYVPASCPKPNIPAQPRYPVQGLKKGDKPAKVMKAYVATVQGQHDYIEQLIHILKGYK